MEIAQGYCRFCNRTALVVKSFSGTDQDQDYVGMCQECVAKILKEFKKVENGYQI